MSESALNYHVDIVHASGGKEFKCKDCEKSFKHKMLLERHKKLHKKNSYHCQHCEKTFALKYYLTQHNKKAHHLVNHDVDMVKYLKEADSETFKCKICNEIFWGEDANRNLANHLVSKCKKNELFSCNSCHKKFTTKGSHQKKKLRNGIPRYQINNARPALSLSFRGRLQYISRLRARGLALSIC